MIRTISFVLTFAVISGPSLAEVRLGKNVRIGGHDASNQTFNSQNRGKYIIHDQQPKNAGCTVRKNADGSKTKVCHLKKKSGNASAPNQDR